MIFGKIIGAILGFLFYGPPGFILGLVFGHIFDRGLNNILNTNSHTATVRLVFFRTVFQTMGYLAKADGVVSVREIEVAREIMINYFTLDKRQTLMAIGYFNEGKKSNFDLVKALNSFRITCAKYSDLRKIFLEIVVKASLADKVVREVQRKKLEFICNQLNIPLSELDYQLRSYGYSAGAKQSYNYYNYDSRKTYVDDKLADAYNMLGVKPSDNIKTIKNAYRRLMSKYHPDKLISRGLPPEMIDVAKEKTQQIIAAYNLILREHK